MEKIIYPKLRWPLDTKGLTTQQRANLLAYDIVWRLLNQGSFTHLERIDGLAIIHDAGANLENLGHLIETTVPEERFEE